MDDNGLPAESATALSGLVLILLFINTQYFHFIKKAKKCNVRKENKIFPAYGSECNGVVDFLLFA